MSGPTSAVVPAYKVFPYQSPQPYAAKEIVGGGIYIAMDAGEGFTYSITFTDAGKTATVEGATARGKTTATAKAPPGLGSETATVTLAVAVDPARTSTATVELGSGTTTGKPPKKHKKKKGKH